MPQQTTNYQLNIYGDSAEDKWVDFLDFRLAIAGTASNSNFVIIDNVLSELNAAIEGISQSDTNTQYSFSMSGDTLKIQKKDIGEDAFSDYESVLLPIPDLSTYATQQYVNDAIGGIVQFDYSVVDSLPASGEKGIIYLVSNDGSSQDIYTEYLWVNNQWEILGTTAIDLSNYATTDFVNTSLAQKVTGIATATSGNVIVFGADGYSVADSGYTIQTSVPVNAVFTDTGITSVIANDGITQSISDRQLTLGLNNYIKTFTQQITSSQGTASGTDLTFQINHNLGTSLVDLKIKNSDSFIAPVYLPSVNIVDENNISITLPASYFTGSNGLQVYLIGYITTT